MRKILSSLLIILLSFTSASAQNKDEQTIRTLVHKKGYPDTAAMGKLDFDLLEVKRLSVMYFFVVGKWHLNRSIGDVGGHFTLLFKKVKNKWVIVADHSS
ncbi:MAG: hypothetical protein IPN43_03915 [Chitinophagaceae bacterium]|nr:hypothetical protein [Chitinophagaceae bacterium]